VSRALFVSNGHGEIAIAARIAGETRGVTCDHLALVGGAHGSGGTLHDVGPRKGMPSGGLIAMGNVRNIARDVSSGLIAHTLAQLKFLRSSRGAYDAAVAVGDVFALIMTLQARARATIFVGTAKSVHHAKYGPVERRFIAKSVHTPKSAVSTRCTQWATPLATPALRTAQARNTSPMSAR